MNEIKEQIKAMMVENLMLQVTVAVLAGREQHRLAGGHDAGHDEGRAGDRRLVVVTLKPGGSSDALMSTPEFRRPRRE